MRAGVVRELAGIFAVGAVLVWLAGSERASVITGAFALVAYLLSLFRQESFAGQGVVITGGSRGLGLALATRLAREGARVAILARDGAELDRACARIREAAPGATVHCLVCDVTVPEVLQATIRDAGEKLGGIDMLVNNAGAIVVGPFLSMDLADFEAQLRLHFAAVWRACRYALPYLRRSRHKRIVNICSMGGKVAVPHMLPYDTSKFALAGFSQGLNAELSAEGISVTTVYPAVMRTGSPIQAVFKGDHEKEFAWFAAADTLPGFAISAKSAARKVVASARRRDAELVTSFLAVLRNVGAAAFPELFAALMGAVARAMPRRQDAHARTGADSRAVFDNVKAFEPLRKLQASAEDDWNQEPKHDAGFNMGKRPRAVF